MDAPTNIVSLGLKWGPKLHAGIGWSIGAATDLGLRAEASVLLDPHGTHVVRGTLFARACFRLL